jgi:hypothetical protein
MAIADFVMRLGIDASLFRQFNNEPDAAMQDADLSEAERSILKARDARQIGEAISANRPVVTGNITVAVTAIDEEN